MTEAMGALAPVGTFVLTWLIRIGALVGVLWAGRHILAIILAGGKGRAAWEAAIGLAVLMVAYAALKDIPGTLEVLGPPAERVWHGILGELAKSVP